jgi:hypothetical protein
MSNCFALSTATRSNAAVAPQHRAPRASCALAPKSDSSHSATRYLSRRTRDRTATRRDATNADVIPSLGRPLSGGVANVQVNVVEAGKYFVEYSNLLDVRIGKIFSFAGSRRLIMNLDIHNILNNSSVLLANNNLASWLTPQSIVEGRLFKVSANLDF